MSSPDKTSSAFEKPGPSRPQKTSAQLKAAGPSSPSKPPRNEGEDTNFSLSGSPRRRVNSIFADVCPRLSLDQIQKSISEEILQMYHREQLPASTLEKDALFSFDQLEKICQSIVSKRDSHLQEEFSKVLNLKLSEQQESLANLTSEEHH